MCEELPERPEDPEALVDVEEHVGRWWRNGGEITAPLWSATLQRNVTPPWWPVYVDPVTDERIQVGPS